jgi:hypothetical protein
MSALSISKKRIVRGLKVSLNGPVDVDAFASDTDIIFAGMGRDTLKADDGDKRDELYGERGIDTCYVDARVEVDNSCNHLWVNGDKVR